MEAPLDNNNILDDQLLDTTQCSDSNDNILQNQNSPSPPIEERAYMMMQLMKDDAVAGLASNLSYSDIDEDFWLHYSSTISESLVILPNDGQSSNNKEKSFHFKNHDALLITLDACEIGFNVQLLSQFSDFVKNIFFRPGSNCIEKTHRRIHLQMFCFKPVLATLLFLSDISANFSRVNAKFHSQLNLMSLKTTMTIFDVATFLQIETIQSVLSDIILQNVTEATLIDVYKFAEMRYPPLAELLWILIANNFSLLIENRKFLECRPDQLVTLLKDLRLNVKPEDESSLIYDWLQQNRPIYSEHEIAELEQALQYVDQIGNSKLGVGFTSRPRFPQSVILAVGGWGASGPADFLEVYEPNRRCWMSVQKESAFAAGMSCRAYHATVLLDDHLYVLGGYDGSIYHNSAVKLNLSTLEWSTIAPMHDRRCYISATVLNKHYIMALGGFNNSIRLSSAEILDVSRNQWMPVSPMTHIRSDGHCVTIDDVCYAIGGFDGAYCHNSCEFYDANRDEWILVGNTMRHQRSGVKAVALGRVLVAVGGFTGETRLRTVEYYDPREGLWHPLANMSLTRSNFGIETIDSNIIVCGGYSDISTTNECEVFDWRANSWSSIPQLPLRRSALSVSRIDRHRIIEDMVNEYDLGLPISYL